MTEDDLVRSEMGHLREDIKDLSRDIRELSLTLKDDYVRNERYNPEMQGLKDRIKSLETSRTWVIMLIVGAVFAAILRTVITGG